MPKVSFNFKSVGKILIGVFVGLAIYGLVQTNPFLGDFPRKVAFAILSMILAIVILSLIKD